METLEAKSLQRIRIKRITFYLKHRKKHLRLIFKKKGIKRGEGSCYLLQKQYQLFKDVFTSQTEEHQTSKVYRRGKKKLWIKSLNLSNHFLVLLQ